MSNGSGSDGQQLCVIFDEAVFWIANRSFSVAPFGPRPLTELPFNDEDDEEYSIALGRGMLSEQILLHYAAKGRIRIYARDGWTNDYETNSVLDFPLKLTVDFLMRAELLYETAEGYFTLFVREEQGYSYLAVNYDDLIREFWGDTAPPTAIRETTARPVPGTAPLRRRGRRPRYPWPDFAAELVRRSISGPPIANQAALEKHMLEWCAATWGAEPAASEIREWVRPTFQMLARSSVAPRAPNGMAGNSSPGIAEAAGK
jgi:hypothetical protein